MVQRAVMDKQMTVEEFLAFTDGCSDGERWELIEGRPVLNPSPTDWHQMIAGNILTVLSNARATRNVPWVPILGVGTRVPVSPRSLPQPDVMVLEGGISSEPSPVAEESLVLFEVLSRSNRRADQAWRKRVYSSITNLEHYVTVSQRQPSVVRHDRSEEWEGVAIDGLGSSLDLPAISVSIPLSVLYRWTPLAEPHR